MANKREARHFFTNEHYRNNIKKSATRTLKRAIAATETEEKYINDGFSPDEYYHPAVDMADTAAKAILDDLNDRSAINIDFDPEANKQIADTVAEVIRQGMAPENNIYERTPSIETHPYIALNNRVMKDTDGITQMHHVREFMFDALIDNAIRHGEAPGDYTPVERCIRAVRGALDIIDGAEGNRPDGNGMPLLQLILAPHPHYEEGRARSHDQIGFDEDILNYGMLGSNDYQTGMARAFDNRYDERFSQQIETRTIRAAKDLFKD